jgi:hypothetical protein
MHQKVRAFAPLVAFLASTLPAFAQGGGLPTSQPKFLVIYQEDVKVGHRAEHAKTEVGWPAAFERAKSPDYYLALVSMTGPNAAWFVQPSDSNAAIGESLAREHADPTLTAELERLSRVDAEHLTGVRVVHAAARPELSYGAFPDTTKQRFYEITRFSVRPGHAMAFSEGVKAYVAAAKRAGVAQSFRTYEVVAGLPGSAYLLFVSGPSMAEFDKSAAAGESIWNAATPDERALIEKVTKESVLSTERQRFQLNGPMSYVSREVRETDPTFWKPAAPKRQTMAAPARTPGAAGSPQP